MSLQLFPISFKWGLPHNLITPCHRIAGVPGAGRPPYGLVTFLYVYYHTTQRMRSNIWVLEVACCNLHVKSWHDNLRGIFSTDIHYKHVFLITGDSNCPISSSIFPSLWQSAVMSAAFAKFHPNVVVGGTYSGQIVLWDNRSNKRTPVQRTPLSAAAHTVL